MRRNFPKVLLASALALGFLLSPASTTHGAAPESPADDPVLEAMKIELARSQAKLKLENVAAPYYIDYQIQDFDEHIAQAAYGALQSNVHVRIRFLRVVARVGDYRQDSYYHQGQGVVDFAPLDNEIFALRDQLWLATDKAYKIAAESLAAKQAQLKQLKIDQPVDDFAHAQPVQYIEPLARLDVDATPWLKTLQAATALYKSDPQVQTMTSALDFHAINRYFVNSEGTVVRTGAAIYQIRMAATAQAADGMHLEQSASFAENSSQDLPTADKVVARAGELIGNLRKLRAAPLADEEFTGPVLFSKHAASSVLADLVGENIRGLRPELGQPARTRGAFASSYKSRVLPDFLSVTDDPTLAAYDGKPLLGHYQIDDEGTKAAPVLAIDNGKLVNYLLGRQPIRDFAQSNGHSRSLPARPPEPNIGNMIVTASEPTPSAEMKKKLIDLCKQRELAYGYYVEGMSGRRTPGLLYRVFAVDGHQELVRGAVFADLDLRSLRNDLVAAGDDMYVGNRAEGLPHSIVNPSILFDELQVKRSDRNKATLPEYPPPPLAAAK